MTQAKYYKIFYRYSHKKTKSQSFFYPTIWFSNNILLIIHFFWSEENLTTPDWILSTQPQPHITYYNQSHPYRNQDNKNKANIVRSDAWY